MPPTVLIVDDHELVGAARTSALGHWPGRVARSPADRGATEGLPGGCHGTGGDGGRHRPTGRRAGSTARRIVEGERQPAAENGRRSTIKAFVRYPGAAA